MATIGLKDLYMAAIIVTGGIESFGTPEHLAKVMTADLSVETLEETLWADDEIDENVKEFVKGSLKLNVSDLEPAKIAKLLGQYIDNDGVTFAGGSDEAPYIAIGFRARKPRAGKYRYIWLYKVKFKIPNEKYETKKDSISFLTPELEGEFFKRSVDDMWKADYTGLPGDEVAREWFTKVKEYTVPTIDIPENTTPIE